MRTVVRTCVIVCLALGLLQTPALARPKVTEQVQHYLIDATTISGLKREMRAKGPRRFWGSTEWLVEWSGICAVEVTVTYTLPKHRNPKSMPSPVRATFDRMLKHLTAHERQHGKNGIKAGAEIERTTCRSPKKIIKKYQQADLELDRRSRHGTDDGVTLD